MKPSEITDKLTYLRGRLAPPETGDPVTALAALVQAILDFIAAPPAPVIGTDPVNPPVL